MKKQYNTPDIEITVFDVQEVTNAGTSSIQPTLKMNGADSINKANAIDF